MSEKPIENEKNDIYHDENGRFKVGNPGGPGRPRGFSLLAILEAELKKAIDGDTTKIQAQEIIAKYVREHMIENSDKGAIQDAIDRFDGEPIKTQEITGKDGEPLTVRVEFVDADKSTVPTSTE